MSKNYQADENNCIAMFWPGVSKEEIIREFEEWIGWEIEPLSVEITQILFELAKNFEAKIIENLQTTWPDYEKRFVVSLDASNSTKSPSRVLEKMVRAWIEDGRPDQPDISRENYRTELPDNLRFRYIVNFLEDGEKLHDFILDELKNPDSNIGKVFKLDVGSIKCSVHHPLNQRNGGERSWKYRFIHKSSQVKTELQICTQLQVAWDKKDHFLIFERKRRGLKIQSGDDIQMKHISDQLYVVDRQLDELQRSILERLRKTGKRRS
jgi:ppGpp synthetase/RelA/SpoT-type nucleotidyltranferase